MSGSPQELVGTWRLVAWHDRDTEDDEWEDTLGTDVTGLATFGPSGTVSVNVAAPNPQAPDVPPHLGYFGTYTAADVERDGDAVEGELHFDLAAAHPPALLDDDEPRPFVVRGDELVLGDRRTWRRRCVRV